MPPKKIFLFSTLLLIISNITLLEGMVEARDPSRAEETSRDSHTILRHNTEENRIAAAQHDRSTSIASPTVSVEDSDETQDGERSANHDETQSQGVSDAGFDALKIEDLKYIWDYLLINDPHDAAISPTMPLLISHEGDVISLQIMDSLDNFLLQNKALFRNLTRLLLESHPRLNVSYFLATSLYQQGIRSEDVLEGRAPFNKLLLKAIVETVSLPDPGPHGFYDATGMWHPWASPVVTIHNEEGTPFSDATRRSLPLASSTTSAQRSSPLLLPSTDQEDEVSNLTFDKQSDHPVIEIPITIIAHKQLLNNALKVHFSASRENSTAVVASPLPPSTTTEKERILKRQIQQLKRKNRKLKKRQAATAAIFSSSGAEKEAREEHAVVSTATESILHPVSRVALREEDRAAVNSVLTEMITEVEKRNPLLPTVTLPISHLESPATSVVLDSSAPLISVSKLTLEEKNLRKKAKQERQQQAKQEANDRSTIKSILARMATEVERRNPLLSKTTPPVEKQHSVATATTSSSSGAEKEVTVQHSTLLQPATFTDASKKETDPSVSQPFEKKPSPPAKKSSSVKRKPNKNKIRSVPPQKEPSSFSTAVTITPDNFLERARTGASAEIVPDGVNPASIYWKHYVEGTWNHPAFPQIVVKGIVLPPYIATMIAYHFVKGITEGVGTTLGVAGTIFRNAYTRQQALLLERRRVEALEQERLHQESAAQLAEENRRNAVAAAVTQRLAFKNDWESTRTQRIGTDEEHMSWQDAWRRVEQDRTQNALVLREQNTTLLAPALEREQNRRFQLPHQAVTIAQYTFISYFGYFIGKQLVNFLWDKYFGG